jgi:hypothetical protein
LVLQAVICLLSVYEQTIVLVPWYVNRMAPDPAFDMKAYTDELWAEA